MLKVFSDVAVRASRSGSIKRDDDYIDDEDSD